ncbi:MAG TPA: aminotransferase class V-fold PLP-dependent enzyme [Candidatus Dormibacteraeota bacterium]
MGTKLDDLRTTDYARLDQAGHVYLDYTGGGLYGVSQVRAHEQLLERLVLGNPHSINPTSRLATELVERARAAVLDFFRAPEGEYFVIFTANASAALKLVGEAYPFEAGGRLLITVDNHNSVNGIREFARARGAALRYLAGAGPAGRVAEDRLLAELDHPAGAGARLFGFPAQSNFTGTQHPLHWIDLAHERGWDVLVDCAAFAPTNRLDLSRWRPDFVPLSFYKMFGYPTGVGCLIARRDALARLRRPWFAGGTVWAVTVQGDRHFMAGGEAAFEDGTVNYAMLPAVEIGLAHLARIGMETIHEHVTELTGALLAAMCRLHHSDGAPLIELYGAAGTEMRGPTISFNVLDVDGRIVDERIVEQLATDACISLRTGCFCNPGAAEVAFGLDQERLAPSFAGQDPLSYDDYVRMLGLQSAGAVRVSLGLVSNERDVRRLLAFLETFRDRRHDTARLGPRRHC